MFNFFPYDPKLIGTEPEAESSVISLFSDFIKPETLKSTAIVPEIAASPVYKESEYQDKEDKESLYDRVPGIFSDPVAQELAVRAGNIASQNEIGNVYELMGAAANYPEADVTNLVKIIQGEEVSRDQVVSLDPPRDLINGTPPGSDTGTSELWPLGTGINIVTNSPILDDEGNPIPIPAVSIIDQDNPCYNEETGELEDNDGDGFCNDARSTTTARHDACFSS